MNRFSFKQHSVLPGFGLTLGYSMFYLSLLVLMPLAATFFNTFALSWGEFWSITTAPRVIASYQLTFGASLLAAGVNAIFGLVVAWVLVRYEFPAKKLVDAMVELPFIMPTAVAGIALTTLYSSNGLLGSWLEPHGIKVAYTRLGILVALTFIGLPFVVRSVQPVLAEMEKELEEAAASLGASRWQSFTRVVFPTILPALISGATLAFARALGEYGSVIFIAGNMPMQTEINALLIVAKLDQFDYAGATAIAVVMILVSFALLLFINLVQRWTTRHRIRT